MLKIACLLHIIETSECLDLFLIMEIYNITIERKSIKFESGKILGRS